MFTDGSAPPGGPREIANSRFPAAGLARISHTNRRIGVPNQRKLLCRNDFTQIQGDPRCRQSVAQNGLILEPWTGGLWKRRSMPDWSHRMRVHCFWERPIERLIW